MSIKMIVMPNSEKVFQQTSLLVSDAIAMYKAATGVEVTSQHQLSVNGRIVTESTLLNDGDYLLITVNMKGNSEEPVKEVKAKQMLPKELSARAEEIFDALPKERKFIGIATVNQGAAVRFAITGESDDFSEVTMLNNLYHGKTISCGGKETIIPSIKEEIELIFLALPAESTSPKMAKKAIETAKELLAINCPMSTMIKITGLTEEQINSIVI